MRTPPPSSIRVVIADDKATLRESLTRRLAFFEDVTLLFACSDGTDLVSRLNRADALPHVILMDIEMPGGDGVEATRHVSQRWPNIAIVMLTVFEDEQRIAQALVAGATGYLLKDEPIERIVEAVRDAHGGRAPLSAPVTTTLVQHFTHSKRRTADARAKREAAGLTDRECEVLTLLAQGHTDASAADVLFLSAHTVQSHTKSLYRKLGVHSRAEAVRAASEIGLIG